MDAVTLTIGQSPLILSMPHSGTFVPTPVFESFNDRGKKLADTDWHIPLLYEGLVDDVTIIQANFHRYVIDANRPPDNQSLYPGQNTTGLCPLIDFQGMPIYEEGAEPDHEDITARRISYHAAYHRAIEAQMSRLKAKHGYVVLYDCHSIKSELSFLFEGRLPDVNVGTFNEKSCSPQITKKVARRLDLQDRYSWVLNGRFKGGWTTRHYGRPEQNEHAIQMELSQRNYMDEDAPWTYRPDKAEKLRSLLSDLLKSLSSE